MNLFPEHLFEKLFIDWPVAELVNVLIQSWLLHHLFWLHFHHALVLVEASLALWNLHLTLLDAKHELFYWLARLPFLLRVRLNIFCLFFSCWGFDFLGLLRFGGVFVWSSRETALFAQRQSRSSFVHHALVDSDVGVVLDSERFHLFLNQINFRRV